MLTIFANIRINSKERLKNLIQSYNLMAGISDDWLINIRGRYRKKAINYLKPRLKNKAIYFNLLDETRGWMTNSLDMIDEAKYNYLLVWNEDHANTAPVDIYPKILKEMGENDVEYMIYSWWLFGEIRERFNNQKIKIGKYIDTILLTRRIWENMKKDGYGHYIISMVAIFRKDLLRKFLKMDSRKLSVKISHGFMFLLKMGQNLNLDFDFNKVYGSINKALSYRLARYPKDTPFELEKDPERTDILPIKIALPKRELFACIDDDSGTLDYQLNKRRNIKQNSKMASTKVSNKVRMIITEVQQVLNTLNDREVRNLVLAILKAEKIVCYGAGRVGMTTRAFSMRLKHLGKEAYFLGESNVPNIGKKDLLIVASGSGETRSVYDMVLIAKDHDVKVVLITGNPGSTMGKLSDLIVNIKAPSKIKVLNGFKSRQPMTTLNEQCLWLFFDLVVLELMEKMRVEEKDMWNKHSVLE